MVLLKTEQAALALGLLLALCEARAEGAEAGTRQQQQQQQQQGEEAGGHSLTAAAARLSPDKTNEGELEAGDRQASWTYLSQSSWDSEFPQCRGVNMRQSPVDIETKRVILNERMELDFVDYNQKVEFEFKNTHHSVSLRPIGSIGTPSLRLNWIGGRDEQIYELQEIHFHWGDGINKGSEHEINDQRAAAEMHMVHYRRGVDKSQIGSVENSVVVIGVLIESDSAEHNKLERLVSGTGRVNGTDREYKDKNREDLINLLPDNHHSFYTYNGSLTTPPCYEVVTWVIMSEPVYMSQQWLVRLSNLEAATRAGRRKIMANWRNIQPLLNRPIYASFNVTEASSLAGPPGASSFGMKVIGAGRLARALDDYWRRVSSLQASVRQAYGLLAAARRRLFLRIGLRQNDTTSGGPARGPV